MVAPLDQPRKHDLATIKEAADYLRETDRSVRRRISEGQLRAFKVGTKRVVIAWADVEALLVPITTVGAR